MQGVATTRDILVSVRLTETAVDSTAFGKCNLICPMLYYWSNVRSDESSDTPFTVVRPTSTAELDVEKALESAGGLVVVLLMERI